MIRILRDEGALYQFKAVSGRYCTVRIFYPSGKMENIAYDEVVFIPTTNKRLLHAKFIIDDEYTYQAHFHINQVLQLVDGHECTFILSDNEGLYYIDSYNEAHLSSYIAFQFKQRSY